MMPAFSEFSTLNLLSCHSDLIAILSDLIEDFDFRVVCGHRNMEEQNAAFESGHSTKIWPNSKHNGMPSHAVDIIPWPECYSDLNKFYLLAGRVLQIAYDKGIPLRWGGDWDMDDDLQDQTFQDQGHFELVFYD
jgi:hypothetical protein